MTLHWSSLEIQLENRRKRHRNDTPRCVYMTSHTEMIPQDVYI